MIKIKEKMMLKIEHVYDTNIEIYENITNNLNLVTKEYKEIISDFNGARLDNVKLFHNIDSKQSFCVDKSGILVKDIKTNELFFIRYETLKNNKTLMEYKEDNLCLLEDSQKREFYRNI